MRMYKHLTNNNTQPGAKDHRPSRGEVIRVKDRDYVVLLSSSEKELILAPRRVRRTYE